MTNESSQTDTIINNILKQLKDWIMIEDGPIFVACSGGLDSSVLLWLLMEARKSCEAKESSQLQREIVIVHVNYGLRGAESDDDERFVRGLASFYGLPVAVLSVGDQRPQSGIQDWARKVRYEWFYQQLENFGGRGWILCGHHLDDQAETVLMRLVRDGSWESLQAMAMKEDRLYRPMLQVPRAALLELAHRQDLQYREDASNANLDYSRNRIRHQVLAQLKEVYPRASDKICAVADAIRQLELYCHQQLKESMDFSQQSLRVTDLRALPRVVREQAVRLWLRDGGKVNQNLTDRCASMVADLADGQRQGKIRISKTLLVTCRNETLVLERLSESGAKAPRFGQHRAGLEAAKVEFLLGGNSSLKFKGRRNTLLVSHAGKGSVSICMRATRKNDLPRSMRGKNDKEKLLTVPGKLYQESENYETLVINDVITGVWTGSEFKRIKSIFSPISINLAKADESVDD